MSGKAPRNVVPDDKCKVVLLSDKIIENEGLSNPAKNVLADWTRLPHDLVIEVLSCLNNRDRANMFSTCRAWRAVGLSPCLWRTLDIREHKLNQNTASSLSSRCVNLQKLWFRGDESADAIIFLKARNLREIWGNYCNQISDLTLAVLVARHEALESLQLVCGLFEGISSDVIRKSIAPCCPNLKKLWLSGIEVDSDEINSLANFCPNLTEIGFIDCHNVDEIALGNLLSVEFLSVAGTRNMDWNLVSQNWSKLPNLIGLDLSRTDVTSSSVSVLLSSSSRLKVVCSLDSLILEEDIRFPTYNNKKDTLFLTFFSDIFKKLASLFADDMRKKERNVLCNWRNSETKDKKIAEIMEWLERIISHSLLSIADRYPESMGTFWLNQGAALSLSLMQSPQEEVKERATIGLSSFVANDYKNAEAVLFNGGIHILLDMARSLREVLQAETTNAIANLCKNPNVAKYIIEEGGVSVLANLSRSSDTIVAEEAARGLHNLSSVKEHMRSFADAGGLKALVDLIYEWASTDARVLEIAASALANLAVEDNCAMEVAVVGLHALVMLARTSKILGVQEQVTRALAILASNDDKKMIIHPLLVQEAGALDALVELILSRDYGVCYAALVVLRALTYDDTNRDAIAAAGGVQALVSLASSFEDSYPIFQEHEIHKYTKFCENIICALWGLSYSEENIVAIGQEGGITPLIAFARSEFEEVYGPAAGALLNLASNLENARRIVEEEGVPALLNICFTSPSKHASFMAQLALEKIHKPEWMSLLFNEIVST